MQHGEAGFYSLVAVYGAVLPGAMLAPAVLITCGPRIGMFCGQLCFKLLPLVAS